MEQLNQSKPIDLTKKIVINQKAVDNCIHEGDVMRNEKDINLKIGEGTETDRQLSVVRQHLNLPDNLTAAKWAISLFSNLLNDEKQGNEIRVREKNGKQYRIDFPHGNATNT